MKLTLFTLCAATFSNFFNFPWPVMVAFYVYVLNIII